MALEVKLKNLIVETLNTENSSNVVFGDGSKNSSLNSQQSQFIISNGYYSETELFLDGQSARFILEDNTSYFFNCQFIGRAENGDTVIMHVNGGAKRGNSANSVTLLGRPHVHIIHDEIGVGDVQFSVSSSNGSLKFHAIGKVATNIRWLGKVDLSQLKY